MTVVALFVVFLTMEVIFVYGITKSTIAPLVFERPLVTQASRNFSQGTDPHLEQIFMGRCLSVHDDSNYKGPINCTRLWSLFRDAFAFKPDEKVSPQDFYYFFSDPDVRLSLAGTGRRSLFWSGVQEFVQQVQDSCHLFVMETSPLVSILNDLMFCGSPTDPSGFNLTSCAYGDLDQGVWRGTWVSFWAAASAAYAPTISGNITLLFSGNATRPAYRRNSFFGSIELPRLNAQSITGATIYVAPTRPDIPIYEPCGVGSMALLVGDLVAQGLDPSTIQCFNDPWVVRHLQCALVVALNLPQCQFLNATASLDKRQV